MFLLPLFRFFAVHGHNLNKVLFVHVLAQEVAKPKHLRAVLSDRGFNLAFGLQSPPHRRLLSNFLLLHMLNLHSFQAKTLFLNKVCIHEGSLLERTLLRQSNFILKFNCYFA